MQLTFFPRVHHAVKAECILQTVFISACASARSSLKCSFIHKYTVQGETSDELFRFFPLPEKNKKCILEVGSLKERAAKKDKEGLKESE